MREFVEKPAPDQIDTNNISAGAYVLERSVLDCCGAASAASIERDVFPRLVGDGLYGHVGSGYWMDIGTPERYLEATFDILEGTVRTEVAARMGDGFICVEDGVSPAGGSCPPRWSRAAAGSPPARGSAGERCSSTTSTVGEGTTIESAVVMRAPRSGPTARCATASSPRACGSAITA